MQSIEKLMYNVFEKCQIQIEEQTISRELLIKTFGDFVCSTILKREHNIGLVMHTGSPCFDAVIICYAAVLNMVSNSIEALDIINSFSAGDVVLYGQSKKERFVFKGIVDGSVVDKKGEQFILLSQDSTSKYVPENLWRDIVPYNGESVRMDGRGIRKRKSNRDDFFEEVLGYKHEDIPSILDTSSVIVASREYADYLVKNIGLIFNKKRIELLELVTASYFTEDDEYRYGGNTGKNEPTLKFTAKVSAARQLLLSRMGNRHLGLIVLGEDAISRGYLELPELINRKSLQYVYICSSMDSDLGLELITDIEDVEIFACTKEFLLENTNFEKKEDNRYTKELETQVNTIIDKNNELIVLKEKGVGVEVVREFKKSIMAIKRDQFSTEDKDNFVMLAYSLMKVFITAPFPMDRFSVARERGIIDVNAPREKIADLKRLLLGFPDHIQNHANEIIRLLETVLEQEEKTNGKYEWLKEYLYKHVGDKVAIIVPKAYYITLLKSSGLFSEHLFKNKNIVTANRFNNAQMYDGIIVLGDYEGKAFNVFRCNAAASIVSVVYECEKARYFYKNKLSINRINKLQRRSTIILSSLDDDENLSQEEVYANDYEKEMEDYISHVDLSFWNLGNRSATGAEGVVSTDIIAVAIFDDDTKAYLSKHYKGYVLEETTGVVKEVEAKDFCEGDSIVFTKNNDDTKDIVSSILVKLFLDGRLDVATEENLRKANLWKNSLVDFMYKNAFTATRVAELMLRDGATVHEQTILHWLDEDSHVIGPRSVDSIRHIGKITGVEELKNNPESIFEACREIRSIRRRILDQVGIAIVDKLSGRVPKAETYMEAVFEKVENLAEIKRVERIAKVDMTVPMGMANRPISL